jgi:hypothetical protein
VLPAIEKFSRINSLNFLDFQRRFDRTSNRYPATTVSGQSQALLHESETVFSCKFNCSQCFLPLYIESAGNVKHTFDKGCPFDPQFITTVRNLSDKERADLIEQLCKRAQ